MTRQYMAHSGGAGHSEPFGPDELREWIAYKQAKAVAFVRRGYAVNWTADDSAWMTVFLPERWGPHKPEVSGEFKFFSQPSVDGIDAGRIYKLSIRQTVTHLLSGAEKSRLLYDYDRGLLSDRLPRHGEPRLLYWAILEEAN